MKKIHETIAMIHPLDASLMQQAQDRLDSLTKPQGSLGRLESLAKQIVGISGTLRPSLQNKVIVTVAADHGVVSEGVSAFPQEVTPQMVYNFLRGGAAINVLARHVGAQVVICDAGVASDLTPHPELIVKKVAYGTKNMAHGPAMTDHEAIKAVTAGIEIVETLVRQGVNIIGTGDMGIGNTTASSAIVAVITGTPVEQVTGRGTGIDDGTLSHKVAVIQKSIAVNKPDRLNGMDVLRKVGGFEIGALAGVFLAAAAHRIPVVIDGFISGAAALIAAAIEPKVKEYMLPSHCSVEQGHRITLNYLGLKPLFDFDMRLGEGTGAALGIGIAEAGIKIINEMATFKDAGVSEKSA
jgi:nicotinate-nucleotide--dimethylbenzimidazole phosphoribosyltransferase